jgi:hypothetical protein
MTRAAEDMPKCGLWRRAASGGDPILQVMK